MLWKFIAIHYTQLSVHEKIRKDNALRPSYLNSNHWNKSYIELRKKIKISQEPPFYCIELIIELNLYIQIENHLKDIYCVVSNQYSYMKNAINRRI